MPKSYKFRCWYSNAFCYNLAGHSDVVLGALMLNDDEIAEKLYFIQNASGAVPGPQDCFLTLRIKTLHVKCNDIENAHKVANFLNNMKWLKKYIGQV